MIGAACGVVAVIIARIPIPQVGEEARSYTQAVGFFLAPLLPVPALGYTLAGIQPQERHAARSLVFYRAALAAFSAVTLFVVLMPAALTGPTPAAVRVLLENTSTIFGLTFALGCWMPARWAWVIVYALALIGVSGPETGWASHLAFIDRTPSLADLVAGLIMLVAGGSVYAVLGNRRLV